MLPLLLAASLLPTLQPGWHHQHSGQVANADGEVVLDYTVTYIVTEGGVYWSVHDERPGGWPWTARFGLLGAQPDSQPSVLLRHQDITGVIELAGVEFTADQPLAAGQSWERDGREYTVAAEGDRFRVESTNRFGLRETVLVDAPQPLIRRAERQLVLGRGESYQLRQELKGSQALTAEQERAAVAQFKALLELRQKFERPARVRENHWTREQIELLKTSLPSAEKAAIGLGALLTLAAADVREQSTRVGALASMQRVIVGKPVQFQLRPIQLGAEPIRSESLKGKVVVLHFWSYQDTPLEEPYGQVGYLDFLSRKRGADQVVVLGVVTPGANQPVDLAAAARAARKLREFMNLGYGIATDEGQALLKQVGDPRPAGGPLPLVVVLDAQGRVASYHAGEYPVDRDRGLVELDAEITRALESAK